MMPLSESAVTPLPEDYFAALAGDAAVQEELEALMQAARQVARANEHLLAALEGLKEA